MELLCSFRANRAHVTDDGARAGAAKDTSILLENIFDVLSLWQTCHNVVDIARGVSQRVYDVSSGLLGRLAGLWTDVEGFDIVAIGFQVDRHGDTHAAEADKSYGFTCSDRGSKSSLGEHRVF